MKQQETYWKIHRKLLIIREMQTITARRYFILFWLTEMKNLTILNVGKVRNHETPIPYARELLERTSLKKHLTQLNKAKGAHVQPPSNSSAREKSLSISLNKLACVPQVTWTRNIYAMSVLIGKNLTFINRIMNDLWQIYIRISYRTEKEKKK